MLRLIWAVLTYDTSPLGPGPNWVTKVSPKKGLGPFVRAIAHALIRKRGMSESQAIRIAIGVTKRAAATGKWSRGRAHPKTRAKSATSAAHWSAMKARAHEHSREDPMEPPTCHRCGRRATKPVKVGRRTYGSACARQILAQAHDDATLAQWHAEQSTTSFSREASVPLDLARLDQMLPDMAAVKRAARKLDKLPPALRTKAAARLKARAKALGGDLDLARTPMGLRTAARRKAKAAGLTYPGTLSYPLAGADGKFSRSQAQKAVRMVGLGKVGSEDAIRRWLIAKLKANGAADLIPAGWKS